METSTAPPITRAPFMSSVVAEPLMVFGWANPCHTFHYTDEEVSVPEKFSVKPTPISTHGCFDCI